MKEKTNADVKASANRRNAKNSTGPKNTSSTRLNATKHGLLSDGITELDDADGYRDTLRRLGEAYFDELEAFLVECIALSMVRLRRTRRLEAELVTSILHPPIYGEGIFPDLSERLVIDPGQPARIGSEDVEVLVRYQRYESANENKLYRAMNQLERIRRIRQGEHLPAPVAVDVTLHSDSPGIDPTGAIPLGSAQRGHDDRTYVTSANETSEPPPDASESTSATE
jgi:hypothetical protein